ncbi:MAG: hypothetical protein BWX50_01556 [Euryarchaeota archaeon ADurb.Bin009]|nr:MAG: hypothetical protein BWX50_01556 [Euryarchaeota archaeon ADurb.Bin009]
MPVEASENRTASGALPLRVSAENEAFGGLTTVMKAGFVMFVLPAGFPAVRLTA